MYGVELAGSGDAIPVAVGHVRVPDGTVATVVGLLSAPQYNATMGKVLSHDEEVHPHPCGPNRSLHTILS